jgi:ribosome-associated translation inhibitor RaiA
MLVKIHAQGFELSPAINNFAESKARLAMGIYRDKIRRVDIYLSDANGPKGGEDRVCKIQLKPDRLAPIVVQETATDLYEAISICCHRSKRAASRRFDRLLQTRRQWQRAIPQEAGEANISS